MKLRTIRTVVVLALLVKNIDSISVTLNNADSKVCILVGNYHLEIQSRMAPFGDSKNIQHAL